jgi:hypothetical protein
MRHANTGRKIKKPGAFAGLFIATSSDAGGLLAASGIAGLLFVFLPRRVDFNRFGHQFIADGLETIDQGPSFLRQPGTPVGGLDQVFFSLQHLISGTAFAPDMHTNCINSR